MDQLIEKLSKSRTVLTGYSPLLLIDGKVVHMMSRKFQTNSLDERVEEIEKAVPQDKTIILYQTHGNIIRFGTIPCTCTLCKENV